jgi:hypothetical protein
MSERRPGSTSPTRQRWHPINNPAELGRIQDQLVETLDRPEITDKLGGLGRWNLPRLLSSYTLLRTTRPALLVPMSYWHLIRTVSR